MGSKRKSVCRGRERKKRTKTKARRRMGGPGKKSLVLHHPPRFQVVGFFFSFPNSINSLIYPFFVFFQVSGSRFSFLLFLDLVFPTTHNPAKSGN